MKKTLLLSAILLPLYACSSGDGDSTIPSTTKTGVFVDSPVIGIGYKTETLSGTTSSNGEYDYLSGENVTFFIGDLELPTTLAKATVTPLDIVGTQDTSNSTVVNIIRLLQTLDKDGNPDNGITITETAIANATQVVFTSSEAEFESSSAITNFLPNVTDLDTPVSTLISAVDAIANLEQGLGLDSTFTIDMTQKTATSVIAYSTCPGVPGGWSYTFTSTSMTQTGSDTWFTPGCTLGSEETFTTNIDSPDLDIDIPFISCVTYPTCTSTDFNKTLSGTDGDSRPFDSTFTFDSQSNILTYMKTVEGSTFTHVITIQ